MKKLFEAEFQLSQLNNKTHLPIQIDLKDDYESIVINYCYGPVVEENSELVDVAINEAISLGSIDPYTTTHSLRNLITPSIRYNNEFIGANHSFDQMEIILGEDSSVGFNSVNFQSGLLEIIMSCHAIVSEKVTLSISVRGMQCSNDIVSYKAELHSHTNHSDASFTVDELLKCANKRMLDVIGITDHNTLTSYYAAQKMNHDQLIIPGIEYTTFDGHFLCLGNPDRYKNHDFTRITKENIFEYLIDLKSEDTLLIMAHPFDTGSPICTGCRYEYDSATHNLFDAIEIWNGDNPHTTSNYKALKFYKALLNENPSVVMTCGRDWHNEGYTGLVPHLKVFGKKNSNYKDIIQAIKSGQSELQYGFEISTNKYLPYGLAVDIRHYQFEIVTDEAQVKVDSNFGYLNVNVQNGYLVFDSDTDFDNLEWIIIEKYVEDKLVAIGNPIFNGGTINGKKTKDD